VTRIDGLDIHFIHVKSPHLDAMPLIITHGWPGSVFELLKVLEPLTNPTAYGGWAEDAFDVVVPSMPGYGFSGKPTDTGWGPERIAAAWDVLMKRLDYKRYVAQGGDWGSFVAQAEGRQAPKGLMAIHLNMPATVPADIARALQSGEPTPARGPFVSKDQHRAGQLRRDLAGIVVVPRRIGIPSKCLFSSSLYDDAVSCRHESRPRGTLDPAPSTERRATTDLGRRMTSHISRKMYPTPRSVWTMTSRACK